MFHKYKLYVFSLLHWPKAHQKSGNAVLRLLQGLVVERVTD